jgi:hypothetical protein
MEESDAAMIRCSDCSRAVCYRHADGCDRCAGCPWRSWYNWDMRSWLSMQKADFRAMMRCCACQRTYCHECDPGPDGQAGARPRGADDGCIYCVSRPEACSGLADAQAEA